MTAKEADRIMVDFDTGKDIRGEDFDSISAILFELGVQAEVGDRWDASDGERVTTVIVCHENLPEAVSDVIAKVVTLNTLGLLEQEISTVEELLLGEGVEEKLEYVDSNISDEEKYVERLANSDMEERFDIDNLEVRNYTFTVHG